LDKCKYFSKKYPIWKPNKDKLFKKIYQKAENNAVVDLIDKMIKLNPKERISARTALNHEYFADLDKSQFSEQINFLNLI